MLRVNRRYSHEAGFTLVEMMAVLVIVGLASALVVLTLPAPESDAEKSAERFAALVQRAAEEAVISGNVVGVRVDGAGYDFQRWRGGAWIAMPGFRAVQWPSGVIVNVSSDALSAERLEVLDEEDAPPLIRFDSTGGSTPFRVQISRGQQRFVFEGDGGGGFMLERSDA